DHGLKCAFENISDSASAKGIRNSDESTDRREHSENNKRNRHRPWRFVRMEIRRKGMVFFFVIIGRMGRMGHIRPMGLISPMCPMTLIQFKVKPLRSKK